MELIHILSKTELGSQEEINQSDCAKKLVDLGDKGGMKSNRTADPPSSEE